MVWDTVTEQQFLERLDTSPKFRDEVRRHVLSAELIAMPETMAKLSEQFSTFAGEQKKINAEFRSDVAELKTDVAELKTDVAELKTDVAELKTDVTELKTDVAELKTDVAELKESNTEINKTVKRIEAAIGELRGNAAYWPAFYRCEEILQALNLKYVRVLNREDLMDMLRDVDLDEIKFGDRRSFYRADLVMEATEAQDPETTRYVAVEASYTADRRDTDRAIRNANILKRCTGHEASAVVASIRNDRDILPVIKAGTVTWYQLDPDDFQER